MPSLKNNSIVRFVCLFLIFISCTVNATGYQAIVDKVTFEQEEQVYKINADVEHKLSPKAKEAIQQGIVLTWVVKIKVKQKGLLWDKTIHAFNIKYQIKNHALLNLYSVKNRNTGITNMFSTLTAALNFVSKIRDLTLVENQLITENNEYYVAIQLMFDREELPVPLRPISYFDSQWTLSSQWTIWPLKK